LILKDENSSNKRNSWRAAEENKKRVSIGGTE
jgi:hypothetical protein